MSLTKATYSMISGAPVNVLDFGADPTGINDSLAAFNAAIASIQNQDMGGAVYVPRGNYFLSDTLNIRCRLHLFGDIQGDFPNNAATMLTFAQNKTGIRVEYSSTSPTGYGGQNSIIEKLFLQSNGGTNGIGFSANATFTLRDCTIRQFPSDGVRVEASASSGTGNANLWVMENVYCRQNGGHGFVFVGNDANAGVGTKLNAVLNGGWGIFDASFLGNCFVAPHCATNTTGAYKTTNINARTLFLNAYAEIGQPPNECVAPTMFVGGLVQNGFTNSNCVFLSAFTNLGAAAINYGSFYSLQENGVTFTDLVAALGASSGAKADNGDILFSSIDGGVFTGKPTDFRLKWDSFLNGVLWANFANSTSLIPFYMTAPGTTFTGGRSSAVPGAFLSEKLFVGVNSTNMRQVTAATAAPVSGTWGQGDYVRNSAPAVGQPKGWICTVSGTPGTWVSEGNL